MNCDLRRLARITAAACLALLWGGRPARADTVAVDTPAAAAEVARLRDDLRQLARSVGRLQAAAAYRQVQAAEQQAEISGLRRGSEELRAQLAEQREFGRSAAMQQLRLAALNGELRSRELVAGGAIMLIALLACWLLYFAWRRAGRRQAASAALPDRAAANERALAESCRCLLDASARPAAGPDENLVAVVADETWRMANRLAGFPAGLPGLAALRHALGRLTAALAERGYAVTALDGSPYLDGMTVTARFVPAPGLPAGERRIVRTIRPQIKYRDRIIRPAEVEVGIGEAGGGHEPRQD